MGDTSFFISKDDWSLHRKGEQDQARHQEKVREAIRKNLADLISEEGIIMTDGRQVVKIPIRSLDEFHFRYNFNKSQQTGQGDGDSAIGDVIAKDGSGEKGAGHDSGAGDQAGADYYEAEVSVDEIQELLFADLQLPNLVQKSPEDVIVEDIAFKDVRKKGLQSNIDKKRTILENVLRNARAGKPGLHDIALDDLRFKTWEDVERPHSQAVVLAMMDTSGSMGTFEKYVARTFFFWMVRFLRTKYQTVDIQFIAHHTEAKVVTEQEFFTKGESGGTICSSAYKLALDLIETKYSPDRYNIYPVHFSDGDNLTSDNDKCVQLVHKLMDVSNLFGYGEVNQYNRASTLMSAYRHIHSPLFRHAIIREKADIYRSLHTFFGPSQSVSGGAL